MCYQPASFRPLHYPVAVLVLTAAVPASAFEWGSADWGSARWGVLEAIAIPAVYGPLLVVLGAGLAALAGRRLGKRGDR